MFEGLTLRVERTEQEVSREGSQAQRWGKTHLTTTHISRGWFASYISMLAHCQQDMDLFSLSSKGYIAVTSTGQ
jgi:hypothetical protein